MLLLEKYGTNKNKDKMTYVMIPMDHPDYPFPYNLEDRVKSIKDKLNEQIKIKLDISVKTEKKTTGEEKGYPSYLITIKDESKLKDFYKNLENLGFKKTKSEWSLLLE